MDKEKIVNIVRSYESLEEMVVSWATNKAGLNKHEIKVSFTVSNNEVSIDICRRYGESLEYDNLKSFYYPLDDMIKEIYG